MGKIKIYTDEDVALAISKALRLRGFESYTTTDQSRSKNSDEEQLEYATSIEAVLLTHSDFIEFF
ncbi:MAG: DUF5615 family PIN-like protein [Nitrospirota bacterium]